MTIGVPVQAPPRPNNRRLYIGEPYTPALARALIGRVAHLLGHHLPIVHENCLGPSESSTGTYRFQHRASANCRAIALLATPYGVVGTGVTEGTLDVPGAETDTPLTWYQHVDDVADLGDIHGGLRFVKPVTPGVLQEHTYEVSTLRLHHVVAFEVPRAVLTGNHYHVDQSHSSGRLYITDDFSTSNARGFKAILHCILQAREDMRRHMLNAYSIGGQTTSGASGYLIGSATAGDGIYVYARDVMGSGVSTTPGRAQVYVSAMTAANTFTFTFDFDGTTFTTAGVAAASVPGWFSANPGLAVNIPNTSSGSLLKVTYTRTGGAGTATVSGIHLREDVT